MLWAFLICFLQCLLSGTFCFYAFTLVFAFSFLVNSTLAFNCKFTARILVKVY